MTTPMGAVGVAVPARDEEDLLPAAIHHLQVAANVARRSGVTVDVLVVADACCDRTAEVARSQGIRVLEVHQQSVGQARAAGLRDILARHRLVPRRRVWLATTDADCRVPPHWLVRQLDLAAAGAELVLGTVDVDDWSAHAAHVERRWRAGYEPRDGHRHVHGANVGARADAYLAVGGFAALDRDEDIALAAALQHRRVARTGGVPVMTSARPRSRTAGGFADHLAELA